MGLRDVGERTRRAQRHLTVLELQGDAIGVFADLAFGKQARHTRLAANFFRRLKTQGKVQS